jgi:F-type H+-transporting ATPase subunit gamma
MQTIEGVKRKIHSTEDLLSVVKTMKAMAAVNIRQYERAVASLAEYARAIESGLHVLMRNRPELTVVARAARHNRLGAVIFGSDQGMCGPLNEQVFSYAMAAMEELDVKTEDRSILAVGERLQGLLEEAGQVVDTSLSLPSSVTGITPAVQDMLMTLESWNREEGITHVYLFYARQTGGTSFNPQTVHLLPIDQEWLLNLKEKAWPSRSLPLFTMDWDRLFSALIRQYLFTSLFRAFAESLAAENASRLASMQGAEKNIEEGLSSLNTLFHQQRQMAITEELLDIVAGFEALTGTP